MNAPALALPKPHPGCVPCSKLLKEWITLTEPAAEGYDRVRANQVAAVIGNHYLQG